MGSAGSVVQLEESIHISLQDFLERAEPFDLIFCHTRTNMGKFLYLNEFLASGRSGITHVGIVVTPEVFPIANSIPGKKYLWDAFNSIVDKPVVLDIEEGIPIATAHIRDLEKKLEADRDFAEQSIGLAKLKHNPWRQSEHRPDYRKLLKEVCLELKTKMKQIPFSMSETGLKLTSTRIWSDEQKYDDKRDRISDDLFTPALPTSFPESLLCVTLVAVVWQAIGVLPNTIDPVSIFPTDFFPGDDIEYAPLAVVQAPLFVDYEAPTIIRGTDVEEAPMEPERSLPPVTETDATTND
jgi:hypothetical protein